MGDYFLINILISCFALTTIHMLKNAPARIRFYVSIVAVLSWFVPWHLVSVPALLTQHITPISNEILEFKVSLLTTPAIQQSSIKADSAFDMSQFFSLTYILMTLFAIGVLIFVKTSVGYYFQMKEWKLWSRRANYMWKQYGFAEEGVELRLTEGKFIAMATGITKPVVWLSENQEHNVCVKSILTHELNHVRQRDPMWLWVLAFTSSLFWWNPLMLGLINIAKKQIELSCDEKCQQELKEQYSTDLANIILQSNRHVTHSMPVAFITTSSNFNIKRIKHLTKEHKMKAKYSIILAMAFAITSITAGAITSVESSEPNENKAKHMKPVDSFIYKGHKGHDELIDELLVIVQDVRTTDPVKLNQIYDDVITWYNNKPTLRRGLEGSLKKQTFAVVNHILQRLNRYQDIINLFQEMYPDVSMEKVMFFRNHLSTAYIQTGETQKAVELMEGLIEMQKLRLNNPLDGSLLLLAEAYMVNGNYDLSIETLDSIDENISALFLKAKIYRKIGDVTSEDEVASRLFSNYGVVLDKVRLSNPELEFQSIASAPLLNYIPDVQEL